MSEPLKVGVPLGIGDTWWVLLKLEALKAQHKGRPLHVYIQTSPNHATHNFVELFPHVVDRVVVSDQAPYDIYKELHDHQQPKYSALSECQGIRGLDYYLQANGHLERGEHIETYLPELGRPNYELRPKIDGGIMRWARMFTNDVLVYPSGLGPNEGFHRNTFSPKHWADTINGIAEAYAKKPGSVTVIGAPTHDDLGQWERIKPHVNAELYARGKIRNRVGLTTHAQVSAMILSSRAVVGLNSGLTIIAPAWRVPTVGLWALEGFGMPVNFPEQMARSWLNPEVPHYYRVMPFGAEYTTPENVVDLTLTVLRDAGEAL